MHSDTLSPGDKIEARCTKCRKNSKHLVVSLQDGNPEQVQCRVCDRQHKYRPPTKVRKVSMKSVVEQKIADQKKWKKISAAAEVNKAKPYSMTESYKSDTLIDHPTFGVGIVQRVIGSQKMEILFAEGIKTMRCK